MEGRWQVPTSRDLSSLVIESMCGRVRGQNIPLAWIYGDFAPKRDSYQGACGVPCLNGLWVGWKRYWGGPRLSDIINIRQITSSEKFTFLCIGAQGECVAKH